MFNVSRRAVNLADFLLSAASAALMPQEEDATVDSSITIEEAAAIVAEYDNRPSNQKRRKSAALKEAIAILAGETTFAGEKSLSTHHVVSMDTAIAGRAIADSILALDRKAGRIWQIRHLSDADTVKAAIIRTRENADRLYADLKALDTAAFVAWNTASAHLTAEEAADANVDGHHENDSAAGNATTVRYDATRKVGSVNKSHHAAGIPTVPMDAAMAAAMADMEAEGF